jgi:hypothetical protein
MSKGSTIAAVAFAAVLVLLALAVGYRALDQAASIGGASPAAEDEQPAHNSFLYGRISTRDGAAFEGRLRFGGNQEAFWGDYFNGVKNENPWAALVPPDRLPGARPFEIFGFELFNLEEPVDLKRPFMARFGDLARIEASGNDVRVTLKSGTIFDLDRFSASDFDDGVRVWDTLHGVTSLDSLRIRSIDFLPGPEAAAQPSPARLHGAVRTAHGLFTGFIQWDRQESLGAGELTGQSPEGTIRLRFSDVRSIAPHSPESSLVTLRDGRQLHLTNPRQLGKENLGLYVDDARYGRVLVSGAPSATSNSPPRPPALPTTTSPPAAPSRAPSSPVPANASPAASSSTSTKANSPKPSTPPPTASTTPSPSASSPPSPPHPEIQPQHSRITLHHGEQLQLEPKATSAPTTPAS